MKRTVKRVVSIIAVSGICTTGLLSNAANENDKDASNTSIVIFNDYNVGITSALDQYVETLDLTNSVDETESDKKEASKDKLSLADIEEQEKANEEITEVEEESTEETTVAETTEEAKNNVIVDTTYTQFDGKAITNVSEIVNIRKEATTDSSVVGTLGRYGICVVKEKGEEWTKIASGTCEGYIKNEFLVFGDDAYSYAEANFPKVVKINASALRVRESADENSECITLVPMGETYRILETVGSWTKIELSEEEYGYVSNEYITLEYMTVRAVEAKKEEVNNQQQDTSTNNTETTKPSTSEPAQTVAPPAGSAATDVVNYALQFVGNPYVYGGNSLTNGTDCSGFVKLVYEQFGYSLPRTADVQANSGIEVSLAELQPGDLLFYGSSSIGHVAMYIGNGQIVHASTSTTGIIIANYNYRTPLKATRIIY